MLADPNGDLTKILTYHVIAGKKLNAEQLADAGTEKTVKGDDVTIAKSGDTIEVNGQSAVVCGNVKTANGTVQIIDTVLMPPTAGLGHHGRPVQGELRPRLRSAVPTDGAGSFAGMAAGPGRHRRLEQPGAVHPRRRGRGRRPGRHAQRPRPLHHLRPEQRRLRQDRRRPPSTAVLADPNGALTKILTYHVIAGKTLDAQQLADAGTEKTVNGGDVTIAKSGDTITVNGQSAVVCGNVQTANATVQIIDTVLMPPS